MKAILNVWKRIFMSFTVGQFHNKQLAIVVLSLLWKKFISPYLSVFYHQHPQNFLKLFPGVSFNAWSKKQHKFSHIYSLIIFMFSALRLYVVFRKL